MNYLLVLPNDTAIGFEDLDQAKWRLNSYHEERIKVKDNEELYSSVDMFEEKSREDLSILIGAEEGEGKIYSIESLLENIRESDLFEEEKEEIIGRLLQENISFDIGKYSLENILADTIVY